MWKQQAEALFFTEHIPIKDIAKQLCKARETVSRHLCALPGYAWEMSFRKEQAAEKRKKYKREWDAANRIRAAGDLPADNYLAVTDATIRAEQALAAYILSRERH